MESLKELVLNTNQEPTKQDRREYDRQRYQKQKEKYAEWYQKRKLAKRTNQEPPKYSEAEAYKVLMSLKEYTEQNQVKKKLFLDFYWTIKNLADNKIVDVVEIMRVRELSDNLISDYWKTAKKEAERGKSWNVLSEEKKQKLVKYWGQKIAKEEERLELELGKQRQDGEKYEWDIKKFVDISKFHEERGKKGCRCWICEDLKNRAEAEISLIKEKDKEKENKEQKQKTKSEKAKCINCDKLRKLNDDELCRECEEVF